jgi:hypothetical protein
MNARDSEEFGTVELLRKRRAMRRAGKENL